MGKERGGGPEEDEGGGVRNLEEQGSKAAVRRVSRSRTKVEARRRRWRGKCSNILMFKCSHVQMFKCSNVQVFKCSNVQRTNKLAKLKSMLVQDKDPLTHQPIDGGEV